MFVICDANKNLVTLEGVALFGKRVKLMAVFREEQDALDVLFAIEDCGALKGHTVENIGSGFVVSR